MGMAADKKLRPVGRELFFCFGIIAWRVSTDMTDQHFYIFTHKYELLGIGGAHILSIDIAIYTPEFLFGFFGPGFQLLYQFHFTKITGMPYFMAGFEIAEDLFVKKTMRVRYETNPCQEIPKMEKKRQ